MARERHAKDAAKQGQGGGGAAGMAKRTADAGVFAEAAKERERLKAEKEAREKAKAEKEAALNRKLAKMDGKKADDGLTDTYLTIYNFKYDSSRSRARLSGMGRWPPLFKG